MSGKFLCCEEKKSCWVLSKVTTGNDREGGCILASAGFV